MCMHVCVLQIIGCVWQFIHRSFDLVVVNTEFLIERAVKTSGCCISTSVTEDARQGKHKLNAHMACMNIVFNSDFFKMIHKYCYFPGNNI